MLRTSFIASLLAASTLVAGIAVADEVLIEDDPSPIRFTSLAPDGLRTDIGARLGLHFPAENDGDDEMATSLALQAQYLAPAGYGGYARLSGARYVGKTGIGNVELGGFYRVDTSEQLSVAVRAGVGIGLGSFEDGSWLGNYAATLLTRPSDLVLGIPETTALRVSAAPTYRTGPIALRADIGIDVVVDSPSDEKPDPLVHADLGAAFVSGQVAGTIELATIVSTGSDDDGSLHALTLGAQYDLGSLTPSVAFSLPFDTVDDTNLDG